MKVEKNTLDDQSIEIKKYWFIGIILISFGVIISTTLKEQIGSLGIVLIAVGGLFFIISLKKKNEQLK